MNENNLFTDSIKILDRVATITKINPEIIERLKNPQRIVEVNFPVRMDSGRVTIFKGYRSQHNNALGPFKGGIRFHPNVSKEEVMSLSFWMSMKCAVANIPFGGGKGGVIVDPKALSIKELEKLSRAYIRAIAPVIGPKVDVPAPDVNTNGQVMAWMVDEYEKFVDHKAPAVITGKPLDKGGSEGREEATGLGGAYLINGIAKLLKKPVNKLTIAIQGFGNVGIWFAIYAQKFGGKIVAVSDSKGGIVDQNGLNVEQIKKIKENGGSVTDYKGAKQVKSDEVLYLPCDLIVPSALEEAITNRNAKLVKGKVILEMANGPVTPDAEKILSKKRIVIVPDILANSGGVTVSYFEWYQNIHKVKWNVEKIRSSLKTKIQKAWRDVYTRSKKYKASLRVGAYILAVERISSAMKKA